MHPKLQKLLDVPVLVQRSDEWFAARMQHVTSSEAATVLGQCKYEKPEAVLFKKFGIGPPFRGNIATAFGIQHEETAIDYYCAATGKIQHEVGLIRYNDIHPPSTEFSGIAGSPDGIAAFRWEPDKEPLMLEFKVPYRRRIIDNKIPEHYVAQVQLNLLICDLMWGDFVEWKPDPFHFNIVRVKRDTHWLATNVPKLQLFCKEVEKYQQVGIENHPKYPEYMMKISA